MIRTCASLLLAFLVGSSAAQEKAKPSAADRLAAIQKEQKDAEAKLRKAMEALPETEEGNKKAGELAAQALIDKVGKEGKIAVMSYVAGAGSEIGRVGGFTDYIQMHSNLKIVGPFYSQSQMATALNQTTDVLAANPDLKGIFGANEPTAIGMARAIKQAGKSGKIVAVGFDGNQDLQEFVKDGTLTAIVVQGSFQMGDLGVKTVSKLIDKQKVDKFVDTGAVVVTKANIEQPDAKNVLY